MKVSMAWLREWVNPVIADEELLARLTMAGLEIDAVEKVAGDFSGVVVGEIISLEKHPDAKKLNICRVKGHPQGEQQVVCGAVNARVGLKIPFALVGAVLPPKKEGEEKFEIKAAKLRGIDSFGMLCGADELRVDGIAGDGLMELPVDAPVGEDLRKYLFLDDSAIEVSITPNRADCFSVRGIAREIGILTDTSINPPEINPVQVSIDQVFPVELKAPDHCSRYVGRIIRNIDISRSSPMWLQEKLRRSGIRSIDAVVDVTNYVLLELGQPMHAFDLNKLQGSLQVRLAKAGEMLRLLNEQDVILNEQTLVIADSHQALAIAGVMGGAESAVSETTKDILLEAAFFEPVALAGKAREYGLQTDSSQRFERGVDFNLQTLAIERATALLLELVGGEVGPLIQQSSPDDLPVRQAIELSLKQIKSVLGLSLELEAVCAMLEGLGLKIIEKTEAGLKAVPPSWRFDLSQAVDLLEEIARLYGYNRLPVREFPAPLFLGKVPENKISLSAHKSRLSALGYQEIITYSFVDPALQTNLGLETGQVLVENPISEEMGVMRTSLFPGLLETALYNLNRQQERIRLFETGLVFSLSASGQQIQEPVLGMLLYGAKEPESWSRLSSQLVDFFDIKGDVEALFSSANPDNNPGFEAARHISLHPGQCAVVVAKKQHVGVIGALHPLIQQKMGFHQSVFLAQIRLNALCNVSSPVFEIISRFPEIRRDLAFIVDKKVPVQALLDKVKAVADTYLTNLKVFDLYSGEGIDPQRKSVALGLTFRAKSRTLTDSEINENVDRVVKALQLHFQADLRS